MTDFVVQPMYNLNQLNKKEAKLALGLNVLIVVLLDIICSIRLV